MVNLSLLNLRKKHIGMAPIDGITDTSFREIVDKYSNPSIMFTEFIPVEGIARGAVKLLHAFHRHEASNSLLTQRKRNPPEVPLKWTKGDKSKTPIIGQVFGTELQSFYNAFFVVAEMGLNGIDINMGCPDRSVVKRGGGAGLILNPQHANSIIRIIKLARTDWLNGKKIDKTTLPSEIIKYVQSYQKNNNMSVQKHALPISLKTRIGYLATETERWISQLLEEEPDLITVHGRTYKQLYTGKANWEEIQKAVLLCKQTKTKLFGNGDITSMDQAKEFIKTYGVDGILVGRAAFGNPWFFGGNKPTLKEKFRVMLEHAKLYLKYRPEMSIAPLRKHFCWYCTGFPGYGKVRNKLMKALTFNEVQDIVDAT